MLSDRLIDVVVLGVNLLIQQKHIVKIQRATCDTCLAYSQQIDIVLSIRNKHFMVLDNHTEQTKLFTQMVE